MNLPNQLSVLRICLTPVYLYLLSIPSHTSKFISLIVFGIAALTDYYDGYIARKFGHITKWGQFLDPFADKVLILAGFFKFACMGYYPIAFVWMMLSRDILVTVIRMVTAKQKHMIKTMFIAKVKTFGQFILLVFIFLFHLLTWHQTILDYSVWAKWIYHNKIIFYSAFGITLITVLSGLIYLMHLFSESKTKG